MSYNDRLREASVWVAAPLDWWEDRAAPQPTHADCTGDGCTCPCHEEARP